jgi:hypothetical protein
LIENCGSSGEAEYPRPTVLSKLYTTTGHFNFANMCYYIMAHKYLGKNKEPPRDQMGLVTTDIYSTLIWTLT